MKKILFGLCLLVFFGRNFVLAKSSDELLKNATKNIQFSKSVTSFQYMDNVENYTDLPMYGLTGPLQHNHIAGTNLILFALKTTSLEKGDWLMPIGLLGVEMLDVKLEDNLGYQNLFLSLNDRSKLYNSANNQNTWMFDSTIDRSFKLINTKSIITRRENLISIMASQMQNRFIYDKDGNYSNNSYKPEKKRTEDQILLKATVEGVNLYNYLCKKGFNDETLRDCIGLSVAILDYDDEPYNRELLLIGEIPLTRYQDVFKATINTCNNKDIFLNKLGWEMEARGFNQFDNILIPSNKENLDAIISIVKNDLQNIKLK